MSHMTEVPLHDGAAPLAFLVGTWRGSGSGRLHDHEPFDYEEEVSFTHRGRSWLVYEQRAWAPSDEALLHTEMGFWRLDEEEDRLYSFISLTAGSDFSQGKLDGTNVSLTAASAPMADGVETVEVLRRDYRVDGDRMTYEVRMASAGTPTELHIAGELRRGPS
jgi:hypothetical protein